MEMPLNKLVKDFFTDKLDLILERVALLLLIDPSFGLAEGCYTSLNSANFVFFEFNTIQLSCKA